LLSLSSGASNHFTYRQRHRMAFRGAASAVLFCVDFYYAWRRVGYYFVFVYSAHKAPQVMTDQDVFGVFGAAFLALIIIGVPLLYWVYKALRRA
jgi:hypothetical protein